MVIHTYPDPVLREEARTLSVEDLGEELDRLAEAMIETMRAASGIGLAATQIGHPVRLCVIGSIDEHGEPQALVNPVITARKGRLFEEEGCLSVPGVTARIRRAGCVVVEALGLRGDTITVEAEGLMARVYQHELDHLNGVLFIDRLSPAARIASKARLADLEDRARTRSNTT